RSGPAAGRASRRHSQPRPQRNPAHREWRHSGGALMSTLLIAAALAQVGTAAGSTPPPSTDATAPQVQTGKTTYVDLEAGAGYSSNPNLSIVNDQGSGFRRVSLHALHSRVSHRRFPAVR